MYSTMSESQFETQMQRIYDTFGNKPFSRERIRLIWRYVSGLPYGNFCEIVDQFLAHERYAPTPMAFKEAATGVRRNYGKAAIEAEVIKCMGCNDLGVTRALSLHDSSWTLVLCDCESGREQSWYLPTWSAEIAKDFARAACPTIWFKPDDPRQDAYAAAMKKAEGWREQIRIASQFWKSKIIAATGTKKQDPT